MLKVSDFFVILVLFGYGICAPSDNRPNIIIFQVDDMGSYDASYHGSNQFLTPNIDALAFKGVLLNRFYTPPMCTPSRSSVMTGMDPHNVGMQHWVILPNEPWGLGFQDKLMSNYFQEAGYSTHLVGKWHLGHFQKKYTPTLRGFDSFYGYYNGMIDYFKFSFSYGGYNGYDFRRNLDVYEVKNGSYATEVFTDEAVDIIHNQSKNNKPFFLMLNHLAPHSGCDEYVQAREEDVKQFEYIENMKRRKYAAMVTKVDESLGKVMKALGESGALKNTIVLFYSDNGAPTSGIYSNSGSNFPLRDIKASPWEGATRNLGFIYSPLIKSKQRVHDGYFHTSDVLPTLASAAGIKIGKVDGFDQWNVLVNGGESPRKGVLNALDTVQGQYSMILEDYKLVASGGTGRYKGEIEQVNLTDDAYATAVLTSTVATIIDDFEGDLEEILTPEKVITLRNKAIIRCNEENNPENQCSASQKSPCLYNIINDPCERTDLSQEYPEIVNKIWSKMQEQIKKAKPSRRKAQNDKNCDPKLHNGVWTWWIQDSDSAY